MARKASKRLTPAGVRALKDEGYYADSEAVGLYVQVAYRQKGKHETGAKKGKPKLDKKNGVTKSWVFRYTSPVTKKVRWMGLGSCDAVTLGDREIVEIVDGKKEKIPIAGARTLAKEARHWVTLGIDPIERRNAVEAAAREAYRKEQARKMTFAQCVELFLPNKLKRYKSEKHRWQWQETLGRASVAFGDISVQEIDTPMIVKFLEPIWSRTPETAARIRGRIEQVLDWAKVKRFREGENPARWQGHLQHVFAAVENGDHYPAMQYEQVPEFMQRLREREAQSARALEVLVLTGVRRGNARKAQWSQFADLKNCLWTIPDEDMKTGVKLEVPLSVQVVALLEALPRFKGTDYLFADDNGKPLGEAGMNQLLKRMHAARAKAGLPPWVDMDSGKLAAPHGFRSSFRDWSGDEPIFEEQVSDHALAHQEGNETKRAYRRRTALKKRALLMQSWADYCDGKELDENVVPLTA